MIASSVPSERLFSKASLVLSQKRSSLQAERNEAGIFFDRVATVGLTKTSWSITVHINISEYITAMNSLSEAMMSLGKLETKEAC
ncbi:hypothetical protein FF38_03418 [Lucilia cuprina]|uniref:HAT C-terminal dimerisation domain-containing protein n=1 Tax=Lucilia cuprina TaxID=7375 RepID=A0A0L0BZM5_LUCCU|nr:hypothetical protein FF38_03418 [Lucilia cuprina]